MQTETWPGSKISNPDSDPTITSEGSQALKQTLQVKEKQPVSFSLNLACAELNITMSHRTLLIATSTYYGQGLRTHGHDLDFF